MKSKVLFDDISISLTVVILGLLLCAYSIDSHASNQSDMTRIGVTQTTNGPIKGFVENGVKKFLGIPYAAPPVGNLRWRPPQPHADWTEVKDTTQFGNTCPQTITLLTFAAKSSTEDCLYLNVFAPSTNNTNEKLPVMVWFHGGGFVDGSGNPYNPVKLVKQGDVIVVTFNYRLNFLGFFALPSLDNENHKVANYGLMDQQFALRWVQKNIANFGGNPGNVTIFGESAGGMSVLANVASPETSGLFQHAIVESPARSQTLRLDQPSLKTAESRGVALAKAVGCEDLKISCLRALSVQQLQKRVDSYTSSLIVDGTVLPSTLRTAFKSGKFNQVPVIIGNNRDERRFSAAVEELSTNQALPDSQYENQIKAYFDTNAKAVLSHYPLTRFGSASTAYAAAKTDVLMICPTLKLGQMLAQFVTVYAYEFADRTAPTYLKPVSFPYGAYHTAELQYLFDGFHGARGIEHSLNQLQKKFSKQMVSYWTNFASTGNPNSDTTPKWPSNTTKSGKFQVLKLPAPYTVSKLRHSSRHQCKFWFSLQ